MFLLSFNVSSVFLIKPHPIRATLHCCLFWVHVEAQIGPLNAKGVASQTSAMSAPSIGQFAEVLSKGPDWYSLSVFLGVPHHELDTIGENYSKISVTRCLIEVYKCLERLGKAPSWDFIASKLRAMDHHALAEHIDSTYIHLSLEPPSESSSSNSEQSGAGIWRGICAKFNQSNSGGASSTSGGPSSTSGGPSSTSGGASSTSGGPSSTSGGPCVIVMECSGGGVVVVVQRSGAIFWLVY